MSRLLLLLVLCVAFAFMKVVVIVFVLAVLLALVTCFIVHPRGTLVLLGGIGLLGLANTQPLACIVTLGVVGVVALLVGPRGRSRGQARLTNAREHHSN